MHLLKVLLILLILTFLKAKNSTLLICCAITPIHQAPETHLLFKSLWIIPKNIGSQTL